jgi:hypothetical protein
MPNLKLAFEPELELFWGDMDHASHTSDFNSRLESAMHDARLPLCLRCWAWAIRWSWGNQCRGWDGSPTTERSKRVTRSCNFGKATTGVTRPFWVCDKL